MFARAGRSVASSVVHGNAFALGAVLIVAIVLPLKGRSALDAPALPERLRDTGLYSDWDRKAVDPAHLPYAPQYPLWSDGAGKSRWVHLPPGTWIDASDPDAWQFPVGTRLWKEFRFGDVPAETRLIERTPEGWRYASYVWNADGSDAVLAPARGILNSVPIRDGVRHAIPSRADCTACHEAGPTPVLSLSALQLSPDRDPNAPHAEPLPAGAVDLPALVQRGLVRGLPAHVVRQPPRIDASSPTSRAALGYLHANCGMCHNAGGQMASLNFSLHYTLAPRNGGAVPLSTALDQPSHFRVPGSAMPGNRVKAGDPDGSVLIARMASRHPVLQMPPLGTRLVDEEAVQLLRRWVAEDLRPGSARHESHRQEQRR